MIGKARPVLVCLAVLLSAGSFLVGARVHVSGSSEASGLKHVASLPEVGAGAGIRVDGDHAYVPDYEDERFSVVDLTDPEDPEVVGTAPHGGRDVAVVEYDDGRTLALEAASSHFHIIDVTDPSSPTEVESWSQFGDDVHNIAVKPGTDLAYVSTDEGDNGSIPIVDVRQPHPWQGHVWAVTIDRVGDRGCHDIEFYERDGDDRMVCAGVGATQVWNVSDPLDPTLIAEVVNPVISPGGAALEALSEPARGLARQAGVNAESPQVQGLHHWATTARDGELLVIGDEFRGGGDPGCLAHAGGGGLSASGPVGALWFYDISDEDDPKLLGWFSPPIPAESLSDDGTPSCTSHFGEVLDGEDRLVVGWYRAGVQLVDFSDPSNPVQVDAFADGTNTWDARLVGDHVVTGDLARGTDILEIVG